eukprot:366577-Chlamydomonas_euryale.AAC.1
MAVAGGGEIGGGTDVCGAQREPMVAVARDFSSGGGTCLGQAGLAAEALRGRMAWPSNCHDMNSQHCAHNPLGNQPLRVPTPWGTNQSLGAVDPDLGLINGALAMRVIWQKHIWELSHPEKPLQQEQQQVGLRVRAQQLALFTPGA